jgi:hypothetical protein
MLDTSAAATAGTKHARDQEGAMNCCLRFLSFPHHSLSVRAYPAGDSSSDDSSSTESESEEEATSDRESKKKKSKKTRRMTAPAKEKKPRGTPRGQKRGDYKKTKERKAAAAAAAAAAAEAASADRDVADDDDAGFRRKPQGKKVKERSTAKDELMLPREPSLQLEADETVGEGASSLLDAAATPLDRGTSSSRKKSAGRAKDQGVQDAINR